MKCSSHFWIPLLLFVASSTSAQQVSPYILNVTSKSDSIGTIKFDWSLGEIPLVLTASGTGIIVTNGFLQSGTGFVVTGIDNLLLLTGNEVKAFPNPVLSQLQLQFNINRPGKINIRLYDINGRLLTEQHYYYNGGIQNNWLDMNAYPSGSYQLFLFYQPLSGFPSRTASFGIQKIR
jgi:hypothetical protein